MVRSVTAVGYKGKLPSFAYAGKILNTAKSDSPSLHAYTYGSLNQAPCYNSALKTNNIFFRQ